ncbi:malate/L-lactate dehydrogenase [Serratia sp. M24T3]|nr:malate/L-lactate dehydrogenase [Serratia sp. M24T3]
MLAFEKLLQPGWGIDEAGNPSMDPEEVLKGAMMTFGGHKGSALSTMVELLAGALINDFTSQESMDFDDKTGSSPMGGELIIAFDPAKFMGGDLESDRDKAERLFRAITYQGARLPSMRRFTNRKLAITHGITISKQLYDDILALEV